MTVHVALAACACYALALDVASIVLSEWLGFEPESLATMKIGRHRRA